MSTLKIQKKAPVQVLPHFEGAKCRCPYCTTDFIWPPEKLVCPSCGRTMRPPVGFALPGKEARRKAVETIQKKAEANERVIGGVPKFEPGKRPAILVAILVGFVLMGAVMISSSLKTSAPAQRAKSDPMTLTTNELAVFTMALSHFKEDTGRFPKYAEGGLLALVSDPGIPDWYGPYINVIHTDGWRRPYWYNLSNGVPVLLSSGPDRRYYTADDISVRTNEYTSHPDFIRHDPARKNKSHMSSVQIGE